MDEMADDSSVKEALLRVFQFLRVARRCLGGVRDFPETSEKSVSLLCDLLELLYGIKDQLNDTNKPWLLHPPRLDALYELLVLFEATLKRMEIYLHPGGVGVREFRKHLLEHTIIPRLEQYKVAFIVSTQPDSEERSSLEKETRQQLRQLHEMEPINPSTSYEDNVISSTDRVSTENFIALADLCNRREPGTCQWIFKHQKYRQWLQGSYRTLYCLGSAGIGKTFLSSVVIDSLQRNFTSPDVAIVFVFSHKEKDNGPGCQALLQNVLAQLIYRRRALSHATETLYDFESMSGAKASSKSYQNAIRAEVNRFSKVFFVIDGLDTMTDRDRFLSRMQKLPEHTQLFITLRETSNTEKLYFIDISVPENDIRDYVVARLHRDAALTHLVNEENAESKMQDDIVRYVVERCNGIFLLAQLHLDLLASYNEKALAHSALTHLPGNLVEAYAEIMKRILSKNPSSRKFIYWTLYSRTPLTVLELKNATMKYKNSEAANCDVHSFETRLLNEGCGLLTIDAVTGTVSLVHKTAKDALELMASASTVFTAAHKEIAETCLTLISSDEVVDDCYMKQEDTSRNCCDTLLDYAASNWGYHACDAVEEEQIIQVLVTTFLNKVTWRRPSSHALEVQYKFPEELGIGRFPNDWTPLHYLAYFNIISRAKRLLEQKVADVDSDDNFLGVTPLHCAAYRGNVAMVELLLDHGAHINARTKEGDTALHLATEKGERKVMKVLLARGIDTKITNQVGHTALHAAIGTAHDEATIPLLVKSKVDVNARNSKTGDTGLHLAVHFKRPRIILFLLNKKAAITSLNKKGLTPLHMAAQLNNCEALTLLLERGPQVDFRSLDGVTALHVAAKAGNWIAFDLLLSVNADINAWDQDGDTLLHKRALDPDGFGIARKLLDDGANPEARNSKGYNPLQCAAMAGNKPVFFLLLEKGVNISVETHKGESLLHITPPYHEECLDILETLLKRGLASDARSSQGWTPLQQTAFLGTGSPDIGLDKSGEYIDMLLSHGAQIGAVTESFEKETALHLAVRAPVPRPSLVSLLIKHGIGVNAKTGQGKTALHLAAERGRDSLFRVLLENGADSSIKAPPEEKDKDTSSSSSSSSAAPADLEGATAFDLAKTNPLGALWFNEEGGMHPVDVLGRPCSTTTVIESEGEGGGSETETGGTTVTGGSVVDLSESRDLPITDSSDI